MKKSLLFILIQILPILVLAQTAQFAWMAGSTFSNSVGPWGTKGVGSATNAVSSRENAQQWTDNSGNFWLFGGNGHASTLNLGRLSDMWKYDLAQNEWTWISGTTLMNQNGIYGTKSVPSSTNNPGGRYQGVTFTDNNGNLWLFGGLGNDATGNVGNLNDMWKFNTSTNEWTWVSGTNSVSAVGVYGTQGVASTTNTPGARSRSVSWVDASGNFWIHGGYGFATTTTAGNLCDLWKFNPSTLEWTWVSGSNVINSAGVYGTKGVPSVSNRPGGRGNASSFMDLSGNFWLFGGNGHATGATYAKLNDLWKFNPNTLEWTWVSGSNGLGAGNTYGVKGAPSVTNIPSGRDEAAFWTDNNGNFWLLGGHGKDASNGFDNELNDLWMYHVNNNTWVYVAGSTSALQSGIYGTKGVLSPNNLVGSRQRACSFKDINGDLWLFGGYGKPSSGTGYLSDWWKIKTCYTNQALSTTQASNLIICSGATTSISASGIGNLGWYSAISGGSYLGGGTDYITPTLTTNTTFYVQDSTCGAGPRVAITVTVNALPTMTTSGTSSVCAGNSGTISVTGSALTYTWDNGTTSNSIVVTPSITTIYTVTGTDINGCVSNKTKTFTVVQLPTLAISGSTLMCKGYATFLNASGANTYTWSTGATGNAITASPSVSTTYTVTGTGTGGCQNKKTHSITIQTATVDAVGSPSICQGSSATYTASGAVTYTWSAQFFAPVYTSTANIYPYATTYSLTGKDALGCTATKTFVVSALTVPTIAVSVPAQQCPSIPVTLIASGASTYTWIPGNLIGASVIVTPTIMTNYTVMGTAVNTCTDDVITVVSVKPNPSISITASQNSVCQGAAVNLYGNGNSISYVWSSGQTSYSISASPTITTTYSLTGTGSNGCSANAVKTITVNPAPDVQVITTETLLCSGQTATLSVTGANTYTWSSGINNGDLIITPSITSNYTVTGTGSNGCSNTTVFTQSVSVCTGVENLSDVTNYLVYPNPTNDVLNIEVDTEMDYVIMNVLGEETMKGEFIGGKNYVDLSSITNGVYFLQLKQNQQIKTIRIVKQ